VDIFLAFRMKAKNFNRLRRINKLMATAKFKALRQVFPYKVSYLFFPALRRDWVSSLSSGKWWKQKWKSCKSCL